MDDKFSYNKHWINARKQKMVESTLIYQIVTVFEESKTSSVMIVRELAAIPANKIQSNVVNLPVSMSSSCFSTVCIAWAPLDFSDTCDLLFLWNIDWNELTNVLDFHFRAMEVPAMTWIGTSSCFLLLLCPPQVCVVHEHKLASLEHTSWSHESG